MPDGKYTKAGVMVDESQPRPQRLPVEMALLIAAVSSVVPSPSYMVSCVFQRGRYVVECTFCAEVFDVAEDLEIGISKGYFALSLDVGDPVR